MITIDCKEFESIKNQLMVYVSDNVVAIPIINIRGFILSPIENDDIIDSDKVVTSIREFLEAIGEQQNFVVFSDQNVISLKSIKGKRIEQKQIPQEKLFSCSHCGFITQYEEEHNNHMKIHYL